MVDNVTLELKLDAKVMEQITRITSTIIEKMSPEQLAEMESLSDIEVQEVINKIVKEILQRPQFSHLAYVFEVKRGDHGQEI